MPSENSTTCKYSVIVLLEEENEDFSQYITMLDEIFSRKGESYEIIIMGNGQEGVLRRELQRINTKGRLKAFALNKKTPQAVCLSAGFKESVGKVIVVCGSYQQLTRESFVNLLDAFDDESDIVSPWRQNRVDPGFNQLQSKVFNVLTKKIVGSKLHDLSCSVKIIRRNVLAETKLYGNMYRFLPVIAAKKGFRTKEVKCEHCQERGKTGFYSLFEYIARIIDILTLYFNTHFSRKPLRFFSILGSVFLALGCGAALYVGIQKIFWGYPVGGRPVLLLALLCMVLGVQAASVGLLGEIIVFTHGRLRQEYDVEKAI